MPAAVGGSCRTAHLLLELVGPLLKALPLQGGSRQLRLQPRPRPGGLLLRGVQLGGQGGGAGGQLLALLGALGADGRNLQARRR